MGFFDTIRTVIRQNPGFGQQLVDMAHKSNSDTLANITNPKKRGGVVKKAKVPKKAKRRKPKKK